MKENTNLAGHQPAHSLSLWYSKDGQALGVRHRGLASRRVAEKHMFHGAQPGRPLARATHLRLDKSLVEQSGANRCGREINLPERGVRLARQGDLDRPAPPQLTIANVGRPFRGCNGIRIARTNPALARRALGDRPGPDAVPKPPAVSRPVDDSID